jgi:hypothetical protein
MVLRMSTPPILYGGTRYPDLVYGISTSFAGDKLQVHLMDVYENAGPELTDHLVSVCRDVRDQYQPDAKLSDITWRLTSGIEDSNFTVQERGSLATRIDFEHGFRLFHKPPFSTYEKAFADPRGFDAAMTSGHGYMCGDPETIVPLTLPHMNNQTQFFKSNATDDVVIADSARLLAAWKRQTPSLERTLRGLDLDEKDARKTGWASGYDAVLLSSPLEDSLKHIFINNATMPTDMAQMSFGRGEIAFLNGRQRLFNAINAGAKFVPVEIAAENGRSAFKKAFEWDPEAPRGRAAALRDVKVWGVTLLKRTLDRD